MNRNEIPDGTSDGPADGKGHLFIMSAPSGAGKTTLCRLVLDRFPDMLYSVSYTTRTAREGERDGVDYHFIDTEAFQQRLTENEWAEWAKVHDHYYGTYAPFLEEATASGRDVLLDLDVQGEMQLTQRYPESVTIFVMPPSAAVLKNRLESRGTDDTDEITRRLVTAEKEMVQKDRYHHVIINDRLPQAIAELVAIIGRHKH
ncbi:MAG: guanylate kinase [Desulfobacterales bacterium]